MASLYEERVQNLVDAASFKEPQKVPVGASFYGWPFSYAGVRYTDLINEPERAANEYVKFFDDYDLMDFHYSVGVLQAVNAYKELGSSYYDFDDTGTFAMNPQVNDQYCGDWIYDAVAEDAAKFYDDTYLKLKLPKLNLSREESYQAMISALKEYKKMADFNELVKHYLEVDKQMPGIVDFPSMPVSYSSAITSIFNGGRGIKNTLIDLRRKPDKVKAAYDATLALRKDNNPDDFTEPWPWAWGSYHPEAFVSPKVYEEIFFNDFRKIVIPFLENGSKFYLMGEGSFLNTIDYFREAPKGSVVIQICADDPFEVHKKIGDWCTIICGLKADFLQVGTKQQCVDMVKRYFDTFAPGGGFIFMPHNPIMSINDGKIENVIAMYETADELSRQ